MQHRAQQQVGRREAGCVSGKAQPPAGHTVYKEAAGEDTSILVPAITGTGKFAVKTPDVDIKVNPDRLDLVETRFIEGRRCLVIAVENNVEVNGMPVKMWEEAQN